MVDLSPTQLLIIGAIVVLIVGLAVFGLRRGLKSASVQGLGVRAGLEGAQEHESLEDQEMQTHDVKTKHSFFRITKGARTSFSRSRFKHTVIQIVPDETLASQVPCDQQPVLPNPSTAPDLTAPPRPTPGRDAQ